jgi:serine/threonine protein kinase
VYYSYLLLLEHCPGGSLLSVVSDPHAHRMILSSLLAILRVIHSLARALAFLHSLPRPIVHRGVSLRNTLLDANGDCKLADFGWAGTSAGQFGLDEKEDRDHSLSDWVEPFSRPPESFTPDGRISPKTDVWMLGCVLYALLFARPAFPSGAQCDIQRGEYLLPASHPFCDPMLFRDSGLRATSTMNNTSNASASNNGRAACQGESANPLLALLRAMLSVSPSARSDAREIENRVLHLLSLCGPSPNTPINSPNYISPALPPLHQERDDSLTMSASTIISASNGTGDTARGNFRGGGLSLTLPDEMLRPYSENFSAPFLLAPNDAIIPDPNIVNHPSNLLANQACSKPPQPDALQPGPRFQHRVALSSLTLDFSLACLLSRTFFLFKRCGPSGDTRAGGLA